MRMLGYNHIEVAEKLGIHERTVRKYWTRYIKKYMKLTPEYVEEQMKLQLSRLESWLIALESKIKIGDCEAVRTANELGKRIDKLLGLEAPTKINLEHSGAINLKNVSDEELDRELNKMMEINRGVGTVNTN